MRIIFLLLFCIGASRSVLGHHVAVHEACTRSTSCPAHASCRPTSCDGYTCLCDSGYVASDDRQRCVKASRIDESCQRGVTRCISEFATCESGICQCMTGFRVTKDGRCRLPVSSFVGETCGNCEFPAQCIEGMCKCAGEFRSLTTEEFWVDPISVLQCRPKDYSLDKCNGTSILRDEDIAAKAVSSGSEEKAPRPTKASSNEWSLILPEKSVYETCSAHAQCPANSRCRPNSCDGFLCLCNVEFVASEDRLQCVPAKKIGESCDRRTDKCLSSAFAKCEMGICTCASFTQPTIDGRCRISQTRYVGETCRGNEDCEYPGTCVNGVCACLEPQRKITREEFWIDPSLTIQCRPKEYNTWKCNDTVIDVPSQFQSDIPIDIEVELSNKKEHKGVDHKDHVEINPAIVVDKPNDDDNNLMPLHIAGILAAALFALLIACIFKTKRRKTIKRDISLTRTNILANKSVSSEEESTNQNQFTNEHLERPQMATFPRAQSSMRRPTMVPVNQIMDVSAHNLSLAEHSHTIPRAHPGQISVYNKHGWHEGFADRSFYDNTTDIYPESSTTTRSTGPFITESAKSPSNGGVGVVSPFAINRNGPYIVDGRANEGYKGTMGRVHYANDPQQEWHQNECMSDNEPDLVLF